MLTLAHAARVTAEIVDVLGRRVALVHDGPVAAGAATAFTVRLDGLAPGVYVLRATGTADSASRRLTVVR